MDKVVATAIMYVENVIVCDFKSEIQNGELLYYDPPRTPLSQQ